ncbi:LCP family glycopolymer transferase [Streptomyces sp. 8N114]|uniref:LCP family glycopolymer transferase n=1 Tax=Streptomyces sp. 8N114 TaxID=3457419 RepID=UPI003FCEE843
MTRPLDVPGVPDVPDAPDAPDVPGATASEPRAAAVAPGRPAPPVLGARREVYGWRGTALVRMRTPAQRHARPRRRRRVLRPALALLVAMLATACGTYTWAETELNREVNLGAFGGRHPAGEGTNYLIVGSDSREGLSDTDVRDLHAGGGGGRRTDSMIVLHKGAHGTVMVSLPRDSWVTIPGFHNPATGKQVPPAKNKLNAAFAYGGPELLARTVEHNTGLRIDHYAEIGFAGFVKIVDAVGGVRLCLDRDIKDEKSGADLRRGCQTLHGREALAFVRQRHQETEGDLGRSRNQQRFLSALAHKAARPGTVLDPSQLYPALHAGLETLVVDQDMDLRRLIEMFRSVQGAGGRKPQRVTVPVDAVGLPTSKGNVIRWDAERSARLFRQLREDHPVTVTGGRRG